MFKYTLLSGSHSNINLQNYIDINVRSSQFNPLQFFVTHSEVAGLGLVDLKKSACFSHSWATPYKDKMRERGQALSHQTKGVPTGGSHYHPRLSHAKTCCLLFQQ